MFNRGPRVKLSVVVPILNEVGSLDALRSQLLKFEIKLTAAGHELEVLLDNNASDDGSSSGLQEWSRSVNGVKQFDSARD